jgi:hypothetical protein
VIAYVISFARQKAREIIAANLFGGSGKPEMIFHLNASKPATMSKSSSVIEL